jgi:abortive infection alpha-like protein
MSDNQQRNGTADDLLRAAPGLARIAGEAWWRTAEWTVETSLRTSSRVLRAALSGQAPGDLFSTSGADVRDYVRRLLAIADSELDDEDGRQEGARDAPAEQEASAAALRERGADLLRRSADVDLDQDAHPAYARILSELAPDEGRILRLLAIEGPQPAVDVRTSRPLNIGTELVAPGLNMIGAEAGCRYVERVHAYLNNLNRLGLIWFSREPLRDPLRYQVLEAQPEVGAALREAGRGKTVRRTIHLTPFGHDFCDVCLPIDTAELDALPTAAASGADTTTD